MICQKLKCFSNQQQNGGHVGGHFGSHFGGQFIKKRQTPFLTKHCKYVTHVSIKYILCLPSREEVTIEQNWYHCFLVMESGSGRKIRIILLP